MDKSREVIIVKKKKRHGHGHHGGAWKVAFADFMTAMFAMFLVLWLVNQSSDVKAAVAGYFQDPLGSAREAGASVIAGNGGQVAPPSARTPLIITQIRRAELDRVAEALASAVSDRPEFAALSEHLEITQTEEGLRIELREDSSGVFFELGSAEPKPTAAAFLQLIGRELGSLPNSITIDGYTDARPYTSRAGYGNWELSADRGNAARRLMIVGGLSEQQIESVRGHADRDLKLPDTPLAPANRRVTITMMLKRLNESDVAEALARPAPAPADTAVALK